MTPKQLRFLDKCLIFVATFIVLFVITMIVIYCIFQSVPDVLVTAVLGTGTVELIVSSLIAISNNINKKKPEDKKDEHE